MLITDQVATAPCTDPIQVRQKGTRVGSIESMPGSFLRRITDITEFSLNL